MHGDTIEVDSADREEPFIGQILKVIDPSSSFEYRELRHHPNNGVGDNSFE